MLSTNKASVARTRTFKTHRLGHVHQVKTDVVVLRVEQIRDTANVH